MTASTLDAGQMVSDEIDKAVWTFREYALAKYTVMAADGEIPCAQISILADMDCNELRRRLWDAQRQDNHPDL